MPHDEPTVDDRLSDAIRALVRALMPPVKYLGFYEYSVVSYDAAAQTANVSPVSDPDMPQIPDLPIRTPGLELDLPQGTSVLVGFRNGDLTKPFIGFFDEPGVGRFPTRAWLRGTTLTEVGANPVLPGARQGDTTASGGLGTQVMFAVLPTGDSPPIPAPMMTMTPYFVSFGVVPGMPATFPSVTPGLGPGQLYGMINLGSPDWKG